MKYKNSFFRIEIKEDGTYLDLYPAVSDGKKLEAKEVIKFLDEKKCDYSMQVIKGAFDGLADKPVQVKISDSCCEKFDESVIISVTPDKSMAIARFYPASTGGRLLSKKYILDELERNKIKAGIAEKVIDVFLMARQYCLNIPIAKAKKPVPATDTQIEYYFETRPLSKPKMLEDGSVDFHELSLLAKVKKGDVLAKLIPHTMGEPGYDVFGKPIAPNKPKIKKLKYGRNITLSEDQTTLISEVDGNVTLTDGTVFVSDTFNVAADVDASTGDIDYDGNVVIPGNVRTGFTVKAKGNIEVNGVVEGATLIAGGSIVIKRGVQGMNRGELVAGVDICAQFFESANAKAEGAVIVGSILHSNVVAGEKIVVSGHKGFIVGGEIICGNYVEVNSIGNKMETQTMIKVGVNPKLYEEMKKLIGKVNEINAEYEETESYLNVYKEKVKKGIKLSPENIKKIKEYTSKLEEMSSDKNEMNTRLIEIKKELEENKRGSVKVLGNIFRGVTIFIASGIYTVKDIEKHCHYKLVNGDIEATPF